MSTVALGAYLKALTPLKVDKLLGRGNVMRRAEQYLADRRVREVWADGSAIRAAVTGTSAEPYMVVLRLVDGEIDAQCSCPYTKGPCWHVGSVLLALIADPAELERVSTAPAAGQPTRPLPPSMGAAPGGPAAVSGSVPGPSGPAPATAPGAAAADEFADRLLALPKTVLVDLLADAARQDPLTRARILERQIEPSSIDLRLFRQAARAALRPGQPLGRYEAPRVAADLRDIARSVARQVTASQPEAALDLLEEIAGLAWRRLDEVDDRDGALAGAVRDVLSEWCRAWAEVPGRDRQKLARRIFGWLMEDEGFVTGGLVLAARDVLGSIGLETLSACLRPLLDARHARGCDTDDAPLDPLASRVRAALRETAEARNDLDEYLRHCDADGGDGSDVLAAVRRLAHDGRFDEALRWAERGRRRTRATHRAQIEELRISLLARLDRRREAIEAAWESFLAEPGGAAYRRLLGVVDEVERAEWRRRALDHAETSSDATAFVDVALSASDAERLAYRLETSPGYVLGASPAALERAAALLGGRRPAGAAKIQLHLAGRLLASGDARSYPKARQHLEAAQHAFELDGQRAGWQEALDRLRETHAVVRAWYGAVS